MEEALIKRIMPNSLEAEQSVIGSMIMDKDAIVTAMEMLISEPSVSWNEVWKLPLPQVFAPTTTPVPNS